MGTFLGPPGGRTRRAAWMVGLAARKLREGPGPWLRAARRGAWRLMPRGIQRLLVRLGGALHRPEGLLPGVRCTGAEGLVSVVLPVYNQADMLEEAIESALGQTHRDLELILLNDGSSDGIEDVLARHFGDPRVRILTQDNQGLPRALNHAFAVARGEFWTWTSADNRMHPRQLERLVAFLREHPGAGMVYADYALMGEDGAPAPDPEFRAWNRASPLSPEVRLPRTTEGLHFVQDNFIGPCFLYRGAAGRLLGPYREELGLEDYDYWMRMNAAFGVRHLGTDEALYAYRLHRRSLTARAAELGIARRGRALMALDRSRRAWAARPFRLAVDEEMEARLAPSLPPGGRGRPARVGPGDLGGLGERTLLLLGSGSLPWLRGAALPAGTQVAVWFDGEGREVYGGAADLVRHGAVLCAGGAPAAQRLEQFTGEVLLAEPGPALVGAAKVRARERFFGAPATARDGGGGGVPRPYFPPGRALRVLLLCRGRDLVAGGDCAVLGLAAELARAGHRPVLAVAGGQAERRPRPAPEGVSVVPLAEGAGEEDVGRLLDAHGADLLSAHGCPMGALAAARRGIGYVQSFHGGPGRPDPCEAVRYRRQDAATAAYVHACPEVARCADADLGLDVRKAVVAGLEPGAADPAGMTAVHLFLFPWLLQGGHPRAVTGWMAQGRRSGGGPPAA